MSPYRALLSSFDTLYAASALPVAAFDGAGVIRAANRAFAQLAGLPSAQLPGTPFLSLVPVFRDAAVWTLRTIPADHTTTLQQATGESVPVTVHYSVFEAADPDDAGGLAHVTDRRELLGLRSELEARGLALEALTVRATADGGGAWLLAQQRVERELTAANAFLEDVLETLSDGVCITDADGRVVRTNTAFSRLLGKPREQIESGYIYDSWPLEGTFVSTTGETVTLDERYRDWFLERIGSGLLRSEAAELNSFEVYAGREDGKVVPVELCMALRTNADGIMIGGVGTARDLTERRRAERVRLDAVMRVRDLERENAQQGLRIEDLALRLEARYRPENLLGESAGMRRVYALIEAVRDHDAPVLISGETGTGKELVARAIHYSGRRKRGPLISVNCSAIPKDLVEAELFGHVRGAYTGALRDRIGHFAAADGGTLFLDEIGEMGLDVQARMLRVLEDGTLQRVGESKPRRVDVRVICATHRDLLTEVKQGRFREDLYYRIHVLPIALPPLRERVEDLAVLCARFVERFEARYPKKGRMPTASELALLSNYAFPGNVRELEHIIERYCLLDEPLATLLPRSAEPAQAGAAESQASWLGSADPLRNAQQEAARRVIREALVRAGYNHAQAAKLLGIARSSLYRKLAEYGLDPSGVSEK